MAAKYNMSEKCIDILYYGKAELLQVYLLKRISICLISSLFNIRVFYSQKK